MTEDCMSIIKLLYANKKYDLLQNIYELLSDNKLISKEFLESYLDGLSKNNKMDYIKLYPELCNVINNNETHIILHQVYNNYSLLEWFYDNSNKTVETLIESLKKRYYISCECEKEIISECLPSESALQTSLTNFINSTEDIKKIILLFKKYDIELSKDIKKNILSVFNYIYR